MSTFKNIKSKVIAALSGHTALTMFSMYVFLIAVNNLTRPIAATIILIISAFLFLGVYEYGEKEIDIKIANGTISAVHFHAIVVPIFIISFGISVVPSKNPSKIYFIIVTLICVGVITKALINTIANKVITSKANNN